MDQILLQEAHHDLQDGARYVKLAEVVFNVAPGRNQEWQWRLPRVPRDAITPSKSQVARRCLPSRPVTSGAPRRPPDGLKMTKRAPRVAQKGPKTTPWDPTSTQRKLEEETGRRFVPARKGQTDYHKRLLKETPTNPRICNLGGCPS